MKINKFLYAFIRANLLTVLSTHGANAATPCIRAVADCTEWITVAGGPSRSLVYHTHALETRYDAVTRAVMIVHGGSRDAHTNFTHVLAAGFIAGALDDTVVVSPRFASNHEAIAKTLSGEDAVTAARE